MQPKTMSHSAIARTAHAVPRSEGIAECPEQRVVHGGAGDSVEVLFFHAVRVDQNETPNPKVGQLERNNAPRSRTTHDADPEPPNSGRCTAAKQLRVTHCEFRRHVN
jgi:hypothetical protein